MNEQTEAFLEAEAETLANALDTDHKHAIFCYLKVAWAKGQVDMLSELREKRENENEL